MKLRKSDDGGASFWCTGCDEMHHVNQTWDIDFENETITPSVLVTHRQWVPPVTPENSDEYRKNPWEQHKEDRVCHSFVRDGKIEYLSDSYHTLAGQTVELKDV